MQYNGGSGYRDGSRQRTYLPRQQQPAPVRPPRSTPPKKRKRKIVVKPRFFVFLLILVLLIVGLVFGIRAGVQALVNTEATVTYGMSSGTRSACAPRAMERSNTSCRR